MKSKSLNLEEISLLSFWSPKGAISMALVVGAPELLDEMFKVDIKEVFTADAFSVMVDSVCGAVIISMVVKSFLIPKMHPYFSAKSSQLAEQPSNQA